MIELPRRRVEVNVTRPLLALCALLSLSSGCATKELWSPGLAALDPPPPAVAVPEARPRALVRAVRTGDGGHHLLVRMSDGGVRHYVVEGGPEEGRGAWPSAVLREGPLPAPHASSDPQLPDGLPLEVEARERAAPRPAPDPALAVLVGGPDDDERADAPRVELEGRRVLVTDLDGQATPLAEFPRPRPVQAPARPRTFRPAARHLVGVGARLVLTPLALAADVVLAGGLVAGGVFLVPFFWW